MKLSIYVASSANGLIANSRNIPDWLSPEFGEAFMSICQKTKAVIMGRTTYNFLSPDNLPLQNEGTIVVLTKDEQIKSNNPTVVFTKSDAAEILEMLEKKGHTEAVIIGGEMTISYFLNDELVDDIYFVVEPVLFGSGLLFFKNRELDVKLNLLEVTKLNTDTIQLHYKIQK